MPVVAPIFAALLAAALLTPAAASADVSVPGTGEPAFTNSAQNTQWVDWQAPGGTDGYRLRGDYYRDSVLVDSEAFDVGTRGGVFFNWQGVATLQEGSTYGICAQGSYSFPDDPLFYPSGPNSCSIGAISGKRTSTTIDRSKPTASVEVAGGAAFTRSTQWALRVSYQDTYSPPFPANFLCVAPGADATEACADKVFGYTPACSVPAAPSKSTTFDCQVDVSATNPSDGPLFACAVTADSSIPDSPSSSNQSGTATQANHSDRACDSVVLDRAAPSVAVGMGSTTVEVGQSVAFMAQASDATSGVSAGSAEWTWGDGGAGSTGDFAFHTFARAGTYTVGLRVRDAAGNAGTATRAITVVPRAESGGGGADGGGAGSDGGAGGSGGGVAGGGGSAGGGSAPTAAQIVRAAGGGSAQRAHTGGLSVIAPRRVVLNGRRRSFLLGVSASQPGRLTLALAKGRRVRVRANAALAAGSGAQRIRLPRGMKAGRHTLTVAFTPTGSRRAASRKLGIAFVKPRRRARGAVAASGAGLTDAARTGGEADEPVLSPAGLPAPLLPDGRLRGDTGDRVFEVH